MKTVLVTGGCGFIGTNLCLTLLKDGHRVIALGKSENKNISHPKFTFIKHDVKEEFKDLNNCDEIYHLASQTSCFDFKKDPTEVASTIILGTINALNFAKKHKANFLYASTLDIKNEDNINFRSCYDTSKKAMESYVYHFGKQKDISCKIIRMPIIYGPYMKIDDSKTITNFIIAALQDEKIELWGNYKEEKPYCFVGDLVKYLKCVMGLNYVKPKDIPFAYLKFWSDEKLAKIIPEMIKNKKYDYVYGFEETVDYFRQELKNKGEL